jgi:hypothetical protein
MRHFSGEFEGVRLLMLDELDAIVGGDGEDTDDVQTPPADPGDNEEIVVTGRRIQMFYIDMPWAPPITFDLPSDPDPAPGQFQVMGDPCPTARSELTEALDNLSAGSPTAAAMIQAAKDSFVRIELIRTDATSGVTEDGYANGTKTIYWDPFSAASGQNSNGSFYAESPTMALMHEIAHWANPSLSEADIMRFTNEIAREMNTNLGTNYGTNRDNHTGSYYIVTDTDSTSWDLANHRPGCN